MPKPIDVSIPLEEYKKMLREGSSSVTYRELTNRLRDIGVINPATRKPYTLSTMYYHMSRNPDFLALRKDVGDTKGKGARPIIVMHYMYPNISKWFEEHVDGIVEYVEDLDYDTVVGRHVYGFGSLPIMMHASCVWWLFDSKGQPLIFDHIPDKVFIHKIKLEKVY